jgi:hypothetical protein
MAGHAANLVRSSLAGADPISFVLKACIAAPGGAAQTDISLRSGSRPWEFCPSSCSFRVVLTLRFSIPLARRSGARVAQQLLRQSLPVREDRWKVTGEVADVAGENDLALCLQVMSDSLPAGQHRLSRLLSDVSRARIT